MDTNKTIFSSVAVICITLASCFYFHVSHRITDKNNLTNNLTLMDKFTQCVQIVMSESRQSGKVIDANQAKEICLNVDNKSNTAKK